MRRDGELMQPLRLAEHWEGPEADFLRIPDPAYDRQGRRPIPAVETYEDAELGARLVLHAFRREGDQSVLSYARTLPPGAGKHGAHLHRDFEERWLVYSGRARYRKGRRTGTLEAGDTVTFERGMAHVDPYNDAEEPLELLSLMSPPTTFAYVYGRTLVQAVRDGKANRRQQLTPLHLMLVLRSTRAETFAAGPPILLQRLVAIPLVAALARLRGYQVARW